MPQRANVHEVDAFVELCARLRVDRLVLRPLNPSPGVNLVWERGGYHYDYQNEILPFEDLVAYLVRDNPVPPGSVLLTGTGLVPPDDFTLEPGHVVEISVPGIGTLSNPVVLASSLVERSAAHV